MKKILLFTATATTLLFSSCNSCGNKAPQGRDELEKLAQALLERETISIDEIDVLLGRKPAPEAESPEAETEIAENADDSDGTSAAAEADL